jgi:hypothetical protein
VLIFLLFVLLVVYVLGAMWLVLYGLWCLAKDVWEIVRNDDRR